MPRPHHRTRTILAALAAPLIVLGAAACQPAQQKITPPPLAKATCTTTSTRSITVNTALVQDLRDLLADAKAAGLKLCGGGYRDPAAQIAVRKANCGTTYYDIYEKPASECTPPTARPGTSMHEKGLAVDFESCDTRTTACYTWLAKHASTYGLKNLPSEPWHWSTTGG